MKKSLIVVLHCDNGDVHLGDSVQTVITCCGKPTPQNIVKNPFNNGDECWFYNLVIEQCKYLCLFTFNQTKVLYRIDLLPYIRPNKSNCFYTAFYK